MTQQRPPSIEPPYFAGLNEKQLAAAKHLQGRALVNAGAGTGKTKTLVARYLSLLLNPEDPAKVHEVLAITYTNTGADEMQERIRDSLKKLGQQQLARQMGQAWISTIHGFCARLLRRYALEAGVDPYFQPADKAQMNALKREALDVLFQHMSFDSTQSLESPRQSSARAGEKPSSKFPQPLRSSLQDYFELREHFSDLTLREHILSVYELLQKHGCNPREERSQWPQELLLDDQLCLQDSASISTLLLNLVQDFACAYDRICTERSTLDFNELLLRCHKLLDNAQILVELQSQFKFVMIDEAQDTNALQLDIIERIAQNSSINNGNNGNNGNNSSLYQVGDIKQSIYRFQGAEPALLRAHNKRLQSGEGTLFELSKNYRSSEGILRFTNALFGNDELLGHSASPLQAHYLRSLSEQTGECVQLLEIDATKDDGKHDLQLSLKAEAAWIADCFQEIRSQQHSWAESWSDFIVLVQYRSQAKLLLTEFARRGMPAQLQKGNSLLSNPMVKEAQLFLEVLRSPRDPDLFLKLLMSAMGRISDQGIYELARLRKEEGQDYLFDTCMNLYKAAIAEQTPLSNEQDYFNLTALMRSISTARSLLGARPLSEIVSRAFSEREIDLYYLGKGRLAGRQIYGGFQQFLRLADKWQTAGKDPLDFVEDLKQQEKLGDPIQQEPISMPNEECITIDSIHSSKGKEFPVVALPFAGALKQKSESKTFMLHQDAGGSLVLTRREGTDKDDYRSPRYTELYEQQHAEAQFESMRLLYVACTRAEKQLLISYSNTANDGLSDAMLRGMKAAADEMQQLKEDKFITHRTINTGEADEFVQKLKSQQDADKNTAAISALSADEKPLASPAVRSEGEPLRTTPLKGAQQREINQVSASDIQDFYKCPRRYYLYRILRLGELVDRSPTKATNRGSLIHLLLEWGTTQQANELFARNQLSDEQAQELLEVVESFQSSQFMQRLKQGKQLSKEQAFYVKLSEEGQVPRYLKGFIDFMGWQADGSLLIVDYKTGSSQAKQVDYQVQADCYALAGLQLGAKQAPKQVEVAIVRPEVRDKAGEPESFHFHYNSSHQQDLRQSLIASIEAMEQAASTSIEAVDSEFCTTFCTLYGSLCEGKVHFM